LDKNVFSAWIGSWIVCKNINSEIIISLQQCIVASGNALLQVPADLVNNQGIFKVTARMPFMFIDMMAQEELPYQRTQYPCLNFSSHTLIAPPLPLILHSVAASVFTV